MRNMGQKLPKERTLTKHKILFLTSQDSLVGGYIQRELESSNHYEVQTIAIASKEKSSLGPLKVLKKKVLEIVKSTTDKFVYSGKGYTYKPVSLENTIIVSDINGVPSFEVAQEFKPDLIVISGTKLVKDALLNVAPLNMNLHHGIVPQYRGVSSFDWVLHERDYNNFGVTVHQATSKVDQGKVFAQEKIMPLKGESLTLFRRRLFFEGARLILSCVHEHFESTLTSAAQDEVCARNLKHADKPKNFKVLKKLDFKNFRKFRNINGRSPQFTGKVLNKISGNISTMSTNDDFSDGLYIVNYHDICSEEEAAALEVSRAPGIYTSHENLEYHLAFFRENFDIYDLSAGLKTWKSGKLAGKRLLAITCDDGLKSLEGLVGTLNGYGVRPTLFFNGAPIVEGKPLHNHSKLHLVKTPEQDPKSSYFSLRDIKEMVAGDNPKIEIGSHTYSHIDLSCVSRDQVEKEIMNWHQEFSKLLGTPVPYFSFPFGKVESNNYAALQYARSMNCDVFDCNGGVNLTYKSHFNLLRIGIHNEGVNALSTMLRNQWQR